MSATTSNPKGRNLLAVIGDEVRSLRIMHAERERARAPHRITSAPSPQPTCNMRSDTQDSVTGLLLAGIGNVDEHQKKNFMVVDASTLTTAGASTGAAPVPQPLCWTHN
jgi:V-type H+-transporting ATPase subunit F